ncbi:MAG: hypothetical protein JW929_08300 [Anaerolineales bacterium]|nr:hypothetical protein [Anaerolineales bacterium]
MKTKKTISVIGMIILTTIVIDIAGYLFSQERGLFTTSVAERAFLYGLIQAALIAVPLGATVWMMLVWDAGDKLPPAFMLILGILGACPVLVYAANPVSVFTLCRTIPLLPRGSTYGASQSLSYFMSHFSTGLLPFLYIGFGITGLAAKRKA